MPIDHLALLRRETTAFADLLAAADLTAPVPSCPGWTLADLGRHTGSVHLWATAAMGSDRPPEEPPGPEDDRAVPAFYAEAAAQLVAAVAATPADRPCWTFDRADRTVAFWARRQVHEVALHRWDAVTATGAAMAVDPSVALDGVDEVLGMFLPRQVRLGRIDVTDDVVHLLPTGTGPSDTVPADPGPTGSGAVLAVGTGDLAAAPVGTVAGPAEALLLLLWRRITPADDRLAVRGDATAVAAVLDRPLTP